MRRFQALLMAVGLAAAPASAAAGPSKDFWSTPETLHKVEWSMSKGRLGVMVMSLTPELRTHLGATQSRGVLVARVEPGTPAAAAGISVGDVITDVNGQLVDDASDVLAALSTITKGASVAVQVVRDKQSRTLQVTMADEPAKASDGAWSYWLREMMKPFTAPIPRS